MVSQEEWLQIINWIFWAFWTAIVALLTRWLCRPRSSPQRTCENPRQSTPRPSRQPTVSGTEVPTAERVWLGTPPPPVDDFAFAPAPEAFFEAESAPASHSTPVQLRYRRTADVSPSSRRRPHLTPVPAVHRHLELGSGSSHWRFYAVAHGRRVGIFRTWEECAEQVQGYPGARYRGFQCLVEAARWLGWWRP